MMLSDIPSSTAANLANVVLVRARTQPVDDHRLKSKALRLNRPYVTVVRQHDGDEMRDIKGNDDEELRRARRFPKLTLGAIFFFSL